MTRKYVESMTSIDCADYFENESQSWKQFVSPGPLSSFHHKHACEAVVHLRTLMQTADPDREVGQIANKKIAGDKERKGMVAFGIHKELVEDLILAFNQGFKYALLYA